MQHVGGAFGNGGAARGQQQLLTQAFYFGLGTQPRGDLAAQFCLGIEQPGSALFELCLRIAARDILARSITAAGRLAGGGLVVRVGFITEFVPVARWGPSGGKQCGKQVLCELAGTAGYLPVDHRKSRP